MPRTLSLIASTTEMVAVLGCLDQLVGRSHECDYPAEVGPAAGVHVAEVPDRP